MIVLLQHSPYRRVSQQIGQRIRAISVRALAVLQTQLDIRLFVQNHGDDLTDVRLEKLRNSSLPLSSSFLILEDTEVLFLLYDFLPHKN